MKKYFKYFISCAVLGIFLLSAAGSDDSDEPKKPLYDDEIAIRVTAKDLIKKNLRDPDSFELIDVSPKTGKTVSIRYRAKNGFGGYNVATAIVTCDENTMYLVSIE